jgi:Flp pilus assembly protein TadG
MTRDKRSRAGTLAARTCRLARGGVAAVEFGLFAPILILTILATIEFGRYIGARIELEQALRAGAQYALKDHVDTAAIEAAVQNATALSGIVVTVNPLACECPGGTSTPCRGEANYSACAGGILPAGYVVIAGATTYEPLFADLSWFPLDPDISETLTMRVM